MTKRELAEKQIELQDRVQALANVNIVTCGHCGSVLLHEMNDKPIECASCKHELDQCDCPDLWYEGCQNNSEFDEDEEEEETYLGNIEKGITNLKVYGIEFGYRLKFYSNDIERDSVNCLDDDHVWRELKARGYKKSFRKVVLYML